MGQGEKGKLLCEIRKELKKGYELWRKALTLSEMELKWTFSYKVRFCMVFYGICLEIVEKMSSKFREHGDKQLDQFQN